MPKYKICLAWHNLSSGNFGVVALGVAHIELVMRAATRANVEISIDTLGTEGISSAVKAELEQRYGLEIGHTHFSLRKIARDAFRFDFSVLRKMREYDLVLDIGEGDSFSDIYGKKRFFTLALSKALAITRGTALVFAPQTIGPFKSKLVSRIAAWTMRHAERVFARDRPSYNLALESSAKATLSTDVAFALPFSPLATISNSIGFNISALLWNGGYTGVNQFGIRIDYRDFVNKAINDFVHRGYKVHLIAHVVSPNMPVEDDFVVCTEVKSTFSDNDDVVLAPRFQSPSEAKAYISAMEFFTGARMHATIGALSSGVATVPIAYSRKFSGLFGSLGYEYTLDAYSLDTDALLKKLFSFFDEARPTMKAAAATSVAKAHALNAEYVEYLSGIFTDAKRK